MNKKRNDRRELSYFVAALFLFLKDSHPVLASDKNLIAVRADSAADTYERMVRCGLPVAQALELANAVLYQDLRFSRFDTVFEVVSEWFPEVEPRRRTSFCLEVLQPAEAVFGKYPIDDDFGTSPLYRTLTIELTGFIQFYIEQHGL